MSRRTFLAAARAGLALGLLAGLAAAQVPSSSGATQPASTPASAAAAPDVTATSPSTTPPVPAPAVVLVDASHTLRSFDREGRALAYWTFYPQICTPNGGLTLAQNRLYVTCSADSRGGTGGGHVFAFNLQTLRQMRLHVGAFAVKDAEAAAAEPLSIAYDEHANHFYVGTRAAGLRIFNVAGYSTETHLPEPLDARALSDDPRLHIVWAIDARRAIVGFAEDAPPPPVKRLDAQPPHRGVVPVMLALCATSSAGGRPTNLLAIAYGPPAAGQPSHEGKRPERLSVRLIETEGASVGVFETQALHPHALACTSRAEVLIGDDEGVHVFDAHGALESPATRFEGLKPPVLGILAIE